MKWFKSCFAGALAAAILVSTASAHTHPGDPVQDPPFVSSWAAGEVAQAESLRLVPDALGSDYTVSVTREQFCRVVLEYAAAMQHCDSGSLLGLTARYMGEQDENGDQKYPFVDGTEYNSAAYYLGIVQGDGDGYFHPDSLITRQEAAAMLTRAYAACGGSLPEEYEAVGFTDDTDIADWARQSAAVLAQWGVMRGMEDGRFAPTENCTIEQCILMCLRLYETAPFSVKNGDFAPLFTYEQGLAYIDTALRSEWIGFREAVRVEGELATFRRMVITGVPRSSSVFYLVYHDGGVRQIDLGVCNNGMDHVINGALPLEDPHFSEDGKTFYCTVTLENDVINVELNVIHEAGVYHITVDVETGVSQVEKE